MFTFLSVHIGCDHWTPGFSEFEIKMKVILKALNETSMIINSPNQ